MIAATRSAARAALACGRSARGRVGPAPDARTRAGWRRTRAGLGAGLGAGLASDPPRTGAGRRRIRRSRPRPDGRAGQPKSLHTTDRRPARGATPARSDPALASNLLTTVSERRYDPKQIEPKWQEIWARERTWEVSNDAAPTARRDTREKSYVLEMLPYPSGEPHIGHLKNYALGDAIAHFHRRIGRRVLHPMGYDAFGLPAENNAIKTGHPPADRHRPLDRVLPALVPPLGDLDRLEPRARHARAVVLPLDPVDLPEAVRARPGLPQEGGGQVVPASTRRCWPTSR